MRQNPLDAVAGLLVQGGQPIPGHDRTLSRPSAEKCNALFEERWKNRSEVKKILVKCCGRSARFHSTRLAPARSTAQTMGSHSKAPQGYRMSTSILQFLRTNGEQLDAE